MLAAFLFLFLFLFLFILPLFYLVRDGYGLVWFGFRFGFRFVSSMRRALDRLPLTATSSTTDNDDELPGIRSTSLDFRWLAFDYS